MTGKPNKIAYLDGIRGTAAFLVVAHHLLLAFYPANYSFDPGATNLNGMDIRYGQSIFSVLSNGHFFVCVFFVLSGFVLSRKYIRSGELQVVISAAWRRFPRLYIPVAFTLILSYVLIKTGAYHNAEASRFTHAEGWMGQWWTFPEPFRQLCRNLLFSTMFRGDTIFDTSLWTMTIELTGSFFVFTFLALTHHTRGRLAALVLMLVYCKLASNILLATFVFGIGLNYIEQAATETSRASRGALALLLTAAALVLGSYPTTGNTEGTLFAYLPAGVMLFANSFHAIGAFFLVTAFVLSAGMQHAISLRPFRFLGRISFSLYLLHPLIIGSFGCYMFLLIHNKMSYNAAVALTLALTVMVCFAASWLMTRFIDEPGIQLSKRIYDRWIKARNKEDVAARHQ